MAAGTTTAQGQASEALALCYVQGQGYVCIGQNYRSPGGEIDLVAYDGNILCFIEVRSRAHARAGHPLETITKRKQQRIVHAAAHYLACHPTRAPCRYDVVGIVLSSPPEVTLIRGAFVPTRL
jgi:putative endonuclease